LRVGVAPPTKGCSSANEFCQDILDSQEYPDYRKIMSAALHCSFCGKSELEIAKLAAGPRGVHICDECVAVCQLVMDGDQALSRNFDSATWPTDRLIAVLKPLNKALELHREHLGAVVDNLREREISWAKIGDALDVSRQTAWERFG
jgi:hypothetical protein